MALAGPRPATTKHTGLLYSLTARILLVDSQVLAQALATVVRAQAFLCLALKPAHLLAALLLSQLVWVALLGQAKVVELPHPEHTGEH